MSPSVSPSVSPTNHPGSVSPTATAHTSPSTSVKGVKLGSDALAATGSDRVGPVTAVGLALVLLGLAAVATARRASRRH